MSRPDLGCGLTEISTGLDSSTTFNIVRCIRNFVQFREATVLVALLQPAPETYDLFDDIILMAEVRKICLHRHSVRPMDSKCHAHHYQMQTDSGRSTLQGVIIFHGHRDEVRKPAWHRCVQKLSLGAGVITNVPSDVDHCAQVLPFFETLGFKCPKRKGVADFLQEVTSRKDQAQYW